MFQSYLPKELWTSDKQSEVEAWLNDKISDPSIRKIILLDWCTYHQILFTTEKAKAVGAEEIPPP